MSFTEFKYASSSACVGCFGSAGFAAAGIGGPAHFGSGGGGALPKKLNPPPLVSANPRGSNNTTCAVATPFLLGVHARGCTVSCPGNRGTACDKTSMVSQPSTS